MFNIENFKCPCTLMIMFDPVTYEEHSFEREFIEDFVKINNKHPIKGTISHQKIFNQNVVLKNIIENYLAGNMKHFENDEVYFSKRFCNEIRNYILKNEVQSLKNKLATTLDYRYFTKPLNENIPGDSAFYLASEKGSKESTAAIFEYLFSKDLLKKLSTPPENWTPKYAIDLIDSYLGSNTFGDLEKQKVTELLKFDKFIRKYDSLYIENLAEKYSTKHVKIVEWLFSKQKLLIEQKDKNGNTMIMRAMKNLKLELVRFLILKNAVLNEFNYQNENLFIISINSYFEMMEQIHEKDDNQFHENHHDIFDFVYDALIKKCPKLPLKFNEEELKNNYLHLALILYPTNIDLIEKVIKLCELSISEVDENDKTALFYACELNSKHQVELLIKYKSDINHVDKFGRNCLHYAVLNNNKHIVTLLVENYIYVDQIDSQNKTPMDLANTEMKNFLGSKKHEMLYEKIHNLEERIKKLESK